MKSAGRFVILVYIQDIESFEDYFTRSFNSIDSAFNYAGELYDECGEMVKKSNNVKIFMKGLGVITRIV